MAEIVDTLFGISPERYQQRQDAAADAQALAFARLDPFQQAQYGIGRGANMLAGAIGGALGGRDPELQRITQRQQILGMIDPNRLESFDQAAQMALQSGDQQLAFGLRMEADKFRKTQSESTALIAQRNAAAAASTAGANKTATETKEIERQNTVYAALTGSTPVAAAPVSVTETLLDRDGRPYTVDVGAALSNSSVKGAALPPATDAAAPRPALNQQIAALESQREQFLALNKIPDAKAKAEVLGDQIKELRSQLKPTELTNLEREIDRFRADGVPDTDPRIKVRQDKIIKLSSSGADRFGTDREAISMQRFNKPFLEITQEQRKVVNQELNDQRGTTAERGAARFTTTQESEFAKRLGKVQGDRYDNAVTLRDNSIAALKTFEKLSGLNDQGLIGGSFASGRVGATNFLNTLGLISPADSATLARSENYQKVAGDAILATLGGRLGAGFSNEDRKFIEGLVPQLENSPAARRQLIDFMIDKNRGIVGETTRLIDFAETKRTLNGFAPLIPLPSGAGGLTLLSDAELRRQYEASKGGNK